MKQNKSLQDLEEKIENILLRNNPGGDMWIELKTCTTQLLSLFSQSQKELLEEIILSGFDKEFGTYEFKTIGKEVFIKSEKLSEIKEKEEVGG